MAILIIYFIFTYIAILKFPGKYSIFYYVSDLGGRISNPYGFYFWNFGTMLFGFGLIPQIIFMTNQFQMRKAKFTTQFRVIGIISSLGFCFVGIFPQDYEIFHQIFASIALIGLFIFIFYNYLIQLKHKSQKNELKEKKKKKLKD